MPERLLSGSPNPAKLSDRDKTIDYLRVKCMPEFNDKIELGLFLSPHATSFWEKSFETAFAQLGISKYNKKRENMILKVYLDPGDTRRLLDYLKPSMNRVRINTIDFSFFPKDMINIFSEFLHDKSVSIIYIDPQESCLELDHWLDIITNSRPRIVFYNRLVLKQSSYEFLLRLAKVVENISFTVVPEKGRIVQMPFSIVTEILSRKCSSLDIRNARKVSPADIERLIHYLHHLEKRVSFKSRTTLDDMNINCGSYRITVNGDRIKEIHFSHMS